MAKQIFLEIISADGREASVTCDRLFIDIADGKNEKKGGSYGIHPGHAKAVFVLKQGDISAFSGNETVLRKTVDGGIAYVENEKVTVLI